MMCFLLEGRKFILFDIFILLNYKWQNSRRTAGERPYVESSLKPWGEGRAATVMGLTVHLDGVQVSFIAASL